MMTESMGMHKTNMELPLLYWKFITREPPTAPGPSGLDVLPNIVSDSLFWSAAFSVLFTAVSWLAKVVFKDWYYSLERRKQTEFPSYVVCLFHHFRVVPFAWWHIYQDWYLTSQQALVVQYAPKEVLVAPFCIGYLVADTLFYAFPEALKGKFEYIIHHVLTLFLVLSTIVGPGSITRFIPHLLICDTTNIFFNSAWILRLTQFKSSALVTTLELLFAFSFLVTRVINMSSAFYGLGSHRDIAGLGLAKYTLAPIALMQWYWFYKIARTIFVRLGKQNKEH